MEAIYNSKTPREKIRLIVHNEFNFTSGFSCKMLYAADCMQQQVEVLCITICSESLQMYSEQNCFQKWQFLKYLHLHISFWMTHPANQLVGCIIQKRTATFRFNFVHNVYIMSDGMAVIELQQPFFVQLTQSTLNYAQKRGEIVASVFRPHCGDIKTRFTFSCEMLRYS